MAGYILRRVSEVIPTVFLVLTLVFLALRVMPGDPAVAALGEFATPDAIAAFREKLGLNDPLWVQYISFVRHALTLDFGRSMANGTPITALLAQVLPYTITLALSATLIGIIIGLPIGAVTAVKRDTPIDGFGRVISLIGFSLPDFYMGVLLLLVFSLQLDWFPMLGGGNGFFDQLHHLGPPAITLGLVMAAFVMRLDTLVAARSAATGLCPYCPRQRRGGTLGHLQARAPQCADPCHDRPRDLCADDALGTDHR